MTQHDLSEQDYLHVTEWATYEGYSDGERAALEYCEKFAIDHLAIDQDLLDRLVEHWGADMVVDMTLSVGSWIAFGRFAQVFSGEVACLVEV